MKLWIWSDLHLEMQYPVLIDRAPDADVIVCAGDLRHADTLGDHARWLIERYGLPMIFVPGNHEFYSGGYWLRTKPSDHLLMREAAEESGSWRNRLHVLDDDVVEIGGVRFVGGTLWTDFRMDLKEEAELAQRMARAPSQLSDFSTIRLGNGERVTPQAMLGFHHLTRGFIECQLPVGPGDRHGGPAMTIPNAACGRPDRLRLPSIFETWRETASPNRLLPNAR